jgi:hypothetical protein
MLLREMISVYCGKCIKQNSSKKQHTYQMFKEAVHIVIIVLYGV